MLKATIPVWFRGRWLTRSISEGVRLQAADAWLYHFDTDEYQFHARGVELA